MRIFIYDAVLHDRTDCSLGTRVSRGRVPGPGSLAKPRMLEWRLAGSTRIWLNYTRSYNSAYMHTREYLAFRMCPGLDQLGRSLVLSMWSTWAQGSTVLGQWAFWVKAHGTFFFFVVHEQGSVLQPRFPNFLSADWILGPQRPGTMFILWDVDPTKTPAKTVRKINVSAQINWL